jgi:hypothetical protein
MLSSCEHRHWDLDSNILDLRNVHTNRHLNPNELGYRNVDRHRVRLENRQWTHPQTRPKDPQQKSPQAPQPKSPPKDHVSQRGRASGSNPHPQASDHPENKTLPGKSHAPDKQTKTWENAVHHQKRLTRRRHPQRTTRHREHLEISWKGERANRPWSLQNFHQICKDSQSGYARKNERNKGGAGSNWRCLIFSDSPEGSSHNATHGHPNHAVPYRGKSRPMLPRTYADCPQIPSQTQPKDTRPAVSRYPAEAVVLPCPGALVL